MRYFIQGWQTNDNMAILGWYAKMHQTLKKTYQPNLWFDQQEWQRQRQQHRKIWEKAFEIWAIFNTQVNRYSQWDLNFRPLTQFSIGSEKSSLNKKQFLMNFRAEIRKNPFLTGFEFLKKLAEKSSKKHPPVSSRTWLRSNPAVIALKHCTNRAVSPSAFLHSVKKWILYQSWGVLMWSCTVPS